MTVQSRASGMDRIRLTGERQFFPNRWRGDWSYGTYNTYDPSVPVALLLLDVFLFEAQSFRRMQHEHFHAGIAGHL